MIREKIMRSLLEESSEDHLSLPWIIGYVARDTGRYEEGEDEPLALLPITDPVEVKKKTLLLVRDLLNTKVFQAGQLADGGITIDPWRTSVEEVIGRIDREWSALREEPDMANDIVWLGKCRETECPHGTRSNDVTQ